MRVLVSSDAVRVVLSSFSRLASEAERRRSTHYTDRWVIVHAVTRQSTTTSRLLLTGQRSRVKGHGTHGSWVKVSGQGPVIRSQTSGQWSSVTGQRSGVSVSGLGQGSGSRNRLVTVSS